MLHVILYEPEIPPNTGNIIRLCANTGMQLHLIAPLGFSLDNKQLQRAGLDYHAKMCLTAHDSWQAFLEKAPCKRLFAVSTRGSKCYTEPAYALGDGLLFGPETRGLPQALLAIYPSLRLPMQAGSRSLNLANAVAIVAYEAWRQLDFIGGS